MLDIPENIKDLFRSDNRRQETHKKFKLSFYDDKADALYPYETLFPDESLFPNEHGAAWLTIENNRIVSESLQITEALSCDDDMVFGSCEGAELQITVADVNEDITNREFALTVEIGGYEMALGLYTVKTFERQSDRRKRKITAYDRMSWFNVDVAGWYNDLDFPMTVKTFRDSLCDYIGIQQTQTTLLFDSLEISKTIEPTQISGLDVLKAICEINGCFGHIDKTGQLVYVQIQQTGLYPSETLYPEETLYPSEYGGDGRPVEIVSTYKQPMVYEDYLVEGIDSLIIRQEENDVGASVGNGENVYTIEGNFLVYGKSAAELLEIAQSLLPYISGRVYRPASVDCNSMPWVEVGDALIIPTRDDIVETFVMKRTITGCQNMRDKIESTGSQVREDQFSISKQIIQLEGKATVITKSVEEVSVRVTDLKNYTEAQFKITADAITAEVTRAQEAEAQLSIRADQISASVTDLRNDTEAKFEITADQIEAEVTRATAAEGELSGRITINADAITAEVTNRKNSDNELSSRITQTATEIRSEVTDTANELSSRITQNSNQIALKVSKGEVSSQISIESGGVNITGNRFSWSATNSSMTADGTLTCKNIKATNGQFSGNITGSSITGGTITGTEIYGGDEIPFSAEASGVFLGDFYVGGEYNRHIFQSSDEVTGMSTGDVNKGNLYLWAGYGESPYHGEEAVFLVNTGQVRCGGDLYVKGVNILEAIRDLGGGGGCTCDSYTCSEDSCGGGDECGAAYSGGGCGCDNDGSGCTCHGYYDVPGCDVVQGCPTDS